jgi:DNA-binding CsgD family transcriptional regulator
MRRETVQSRHYSSLTYVEPEVPFNFSPDHAFANVLVSAAAVEDPLLSILERIGCGGVVLDSANRVIAINLPALRLLRQDVEPSVANDRNWVSGAVGQLLNRVSSRLGSEGTTWVTVPRESGRPLAVLQFSPYTRGGNTVLMILDMDCSLQPRPLTLQRLFGLTPAEIKLASGIAVGFSPTDLARHLGRSRTTIRSQLASIFAKTHTRRQGELVALLARISMLP